MKITIKDIAKKCGVSIGTVDRAIHNRDGINLETKNKILEIIKKYDYKPNTLAKALKKSQNQKKIVIIIPDSSINNFAYELMKGINDEYEKIKDFGVILEWKFVKSFDVNEQLDILKNLYKKDIRALIIRPINDIRIKEEIYKLKKEGIEICTVVSDVEKLENISFVKNNQIREGKFMLSILSKIIRSYNIALITGNKMYRNHELKIKGLKEYLENNMKRGTLTIFDTSYDYMENLQKMNPDAIIIQSLGKNGINKIYEKFPNKIIVAFGTREDLKDMIDSKILTFAIDEQPYLQGSLAMQLIFEILFYGYTKEKNIEIDTPLIIDI